MEKMQTGILVSVAAVSVAAGFLAGAVAFGGNKREMPDGPVSTRVRRYFDEAACRRGAAFLDEKLQASRSPGEMAGLGVAATALRQAELYDFTVNYLERLPAEALYDALADEAAWQKLYDRVLTESANYTGGSVTPMENAQAVGALVRNRIDFLRLSPAGKKLFLSLAGQNFSDEFYPGGGEPAVKLEEGTALIRRSNAEAVRYWLLPGLCTESGTKKAAVIRAVPGIAAPEYLLLVIWRDGLPVKTVKLPGSILVSELRLATEPERVVVSYSRPGRTETESFSFRF